MIIKRRYHVEYETQNSEPSNDIKTNASCQFLQLKTIFVEPLPYRMDPLRNSVAAGDPAVLPHSQVDDPTFPILLFASRIHHCRAHLVGPAAMNFGANEPSFATGPNIRRSQEIYPLVN